MEAYDDLMEMYKNFLNFLNADYEPSFDRNEDHDELEFEGFVTFNRLVRDNSRYALRKFVALYVFDSFLIND
jgi:hypothetical protein